MIHVSRLGIYHESSTSKYWGHHNSYNHTSHIVNLQGTAYVCGAIQNIKLNWWDTVWCATSVTHKYKATNKCMPDHKMSRTLPWMFFGPVRERSEAFTCHKLIQNCQSWSGPTDTSIVLQKRDLLWYGKQSNVPNQMQPLKIRFRRILALGAAPVNEQKKDTVKARKQNVA